MYVPLHNRSAYSFGTALTRPAELVNFAVEHNIPAVALTDRDGLYAAITFQQLCQQAGIKPIIGVELSVAGGGVVTLLACNTIGYGNLCRLIFRRHLDEQPPDITNLCNRAEGLICLLGRGWGPPEHKSKHTAYNHCNELGFNEAQADVINDQQFMGLDASRLEPLRQAFADRLYVELNLHRAEELPGVRRRARLADELKIPVVAGGESRCLRPEQGAVLRALASIGTLTLLDQPHPDKPIGNWHLRTPTQMQRMFRRRPDALENTFRIAQRCNFHLDLDRNRFPDFTSPDGRSAMEHLCELCIAGCRRRYVEQTPQKGIGGRRATLSEALERLERELKVIEQVGYAGYFLVFHEIVAYCRREGIEPLARGSAADSLICYALGVSHVCPFRFNLPFDRFINPERAKFSKMADIDLDLPWDQRDQVINWVYQRWGNDRVAMIGSPNTFQARAAVADLGRVFGLPPQEVHEITRRMYQRHTQNLIGSLATSARTRELAVDKEPLPTILRVARELEGLPRHWSMHPCGLVVSPQPLTELVPVQRSPKGPLVAQYDMDAIEDLGFIKIDLLGQAGLSVLRDTVAEVQRTEGRRIKLAEDVDYAEPQIWEMIATGGARGVHHIESPAMTSLLAQCNCRDIDCLTAIVALIRPGAANQGRKNTFARRYQGFEPPDYAHPVLESVLKETYGLMVFEEHILHVAVEFAGMNLGRADVLRRALNKQQLDLVAELKNEFFEYARHKGRPSPDIEAVWSVVERFCGFMFNKAHSAEYAVEALQGAWLKRRWPAHFLAAILSNYRGFYAGSPTLPQILYVLEARRLGIDLLPPCVNCSREHFAVEYVLDENDKQQREYGQPRAMIRIPVTHIKGLSQTFLQRYLAERDKEAFTSFRDFLRRCRPGPAEGRLLLDSGALDGFGSHQPVTLWDERDGKREAFLPPVELCGPDRYQLARREQDLLGFPVTIDPLTFLGRNDQGHEIDWSRYVPVNRLPEYAGKRVHVCGLMVADRMNATPTGDLMMFVTLADHTGFVETILFPNAYRRFGHLAVAHPILAAAGVVERFENGKGVNLRIQHLSPPTYASSAHEHTDDDGRNKKKAPPRVQTT